ncbi:SIS domain-containing protein [Streptosporangium sp. NPDC023963]|uniref:SIS domain-containing protein n=1 Tax=Streptosporangium sp. NPDC023963 TaxID=3155608 RepID=UPI00341593C8
MTSRITFRDGQERQPQALQEIAAHLREQLAGPHATRLSGARRPLFLGIGASYAALAVPVELLREQGVAAQRALASEVGPAGRGFDTDLLIGVSQSGRSLETIAAFRELAAVPRVAVLNVVPSPLADLADLGVGLGNQPDSYASTIGFTGTIVALDLMAELIAARPAVADPWRDIAAQVTGVRSTAMDVLASVRERAAGCVAADVVGSGASRASAEEGALLLREVTRMPASASATRNYLHGEMESAGRTLHVIFGDGREVELARSLSEAGHLTLLVTGTAVEPTADLAVVSLPGAATGARIVLETVVVQELVATLADERGVAIESFVFANDDTKEGGVDPADFAIASPRAQSR